MDGLPFQPGLSCHCLTLDRFAGDHVIALAPVRVAGDTRSGSRSACSYGVCSSDFESGDGSPFGSLAIETSWCLYCMAGSPVRKQGAWTVTSSPVRSITASTSGKPRSHHAAQLQALFAKPILHINVFGSVGLSTIENSTAHSCSPPTSSSMISTANDWAPD